MTTRPLNYDHVIGKKFGSLTIIEIISMPEKGDGKWALCKCECGSTKTIRLTGVKTGKTKSCGCKSRQALINGREKHGFAHHKLYRVLKDMNRRCYNKKCKTYIHYGGRGIHICDEWLNNKSLFFKWALENGYAEGLTIERDDVNGNYEPSNCKWVTHKDQQNNRRDNNFLNYNGETKTLSQWAELSGIHRATLDNRIKKGWALNKIFARPLKVGKTAYKK